MRRSKNVVLRALREGGNRCGIIGAEAYGIRLLVFLICCFLNKYSIALCEIDFNL